MGMNATFSKAMHLLFQINYINKTIVEIKEKCYGNGCENQIFLTIRCFNYSKETFTSLMDIAGLYVFS